MPVIAGTGNKAGDTAVESLSVAEMVTETASRLVRDAAPLGNKLFQQRVKKQTDQIWIAHQSDLFSTAFAKKSGGIGIVAPQLSCHQLEATA